jgi:hypothetical protein
MKALGCLCYKLAKVWWHHLLCWTNYCPLSCQVSKFWFWAILGFMLSMTANIWRSCPLTGTSIRSLLRSPLIDWLHAGSGPYSPDAPRPLLTGPLCPITIYGSPVALPEFQMAPRITFLIFSGSRKEPRYACVSEAMASHQRIWAEVSSYAPHFLHNGLSISPIKWRCLLRVLCQVRIPVTTLDCILLKDKSAQTGSLCPVRIPVTTLDCILLKDKSAQTGSWD